MALDHGLLNLPLHKRGINIDREIDAFKADQARQARTARKDREAARKAAKVEAVALIEALTEDRLNTLAQHCKTTPAALLKHLRSQAHWDPQFVIRVLAA